MESKQPAVWLFFTLGMSSVCFIVFLKVYWSITLRHWNQLPSHPLSLQGVDRETPSFMETSAVPILWMQAYHTPARAHTHIQHNPAAASLSPAWKATVTNRCCRRVFFLLFFLSPSPHQAFFSSLGIKWSNDVLLQNSISQFS